MTIATADFACEWGVERLRSSLFIAFQTTQEQLGREPRRLVDKHARLSISTSELVE